VRSGRSFPGGSPPGCDEPRSNSAKVYRVVRIPLDPLPRAFVDCRRRLFPKGRRRSEAPRRRHDRPPRGAREVIERRQRIVVHVEDRLGRGRVDGAAPRVLALRSEMGLGPIRGREVHRVARARQEERHREVRHRRPVRERVLLRVRNLLALPCSALLRPRLKRPAPVVHRPRAPTEPERRPGPPPAAKPLHSHS